VRLPAQRFEDILIDPVSAVASNFKAKNDRLEVAMETSINPFDHFISHRTHHTATAKKAKRQRYTAK
jgi:hypothetical protein